MTDTPQYGLEQAQAQLSFIASEAVAGTSSVISRYRTGGGGGADGAMA